MPDKWQGIFTILLTPFNEDHSLDLDSLRREVSFVVEAGAHGIVTPVNTSEFSFLSEGERRQIAETVVAEAKGRLPVVIGTAAPEAGTALSLTRHARSIGAAGVIAMPPFGTKPDEAAIRDFYANLAVAADGLPVVVQNTQNVGGEAGVPMRSKFVADLAAEIPAVRYVKEETSPSTHRISDLLGQAGGKLDGVFGGSGARYLVDELKRGACGLMSGCHLVDAQVRVFELLKAGREAEARAALTRQLPAQILWSLLGLGVAKEILRRRGVFRTIICRRSANALDQADHAELDYVLQLVLSDLSVKL